MSVRERSEDDSRKVHPFIRAILKKEKSEDIAKEIIGAHLEDQKREIGPDEQNVGKEINRITENLIEVTDYLGTDLPEDLRHVQNFNQIQISYCYAVDLDPYCENMSVKHFGSDQSKWKKISAIAQMQKRKHQRDPQRK